MENNNNFTYEAMFKKAIHLAKLPILISLVLTPVRFTLELVGVNENYIFYIGLLWLTLGFSIYWTIKHHNLDRFLMVLLLSLIVYSPISRIPVAIVWWVDTKWQLDTHYGMFFESFGEVLLNHVFYGSLVQIIPAFILGLITFAIVKSRQNQKIKTAA